MRRHIAILAAGVLLAACGNDPSSSDAELDPQNAVLTAEAGQPFRLRAGQVANVGGAGLVIGFRGVGGDSRCPTGVQCVWSGDAAVHLLATVGRMAWTPVELHTHVEPRTGAFQDYRIRLISLEPYPEQGKQIRPAAYVATLEITR
jgi:hypothetical protein